MYTYNLYTRLKRCSFKKLYKAFKNKIDFNT